MYSRFKNFSCTACGSGWISFLEDKRLQLRGSDEGETLFYVCRDCKSESRKNV